MTFVGAKVSKPGFDATTAAKENLVFSSEYDTLKVFFSSGGSVSVPATGGVLVEVTHNLGYKPAFICFSSTPYASDDKLSPYSYKSVGALHNTPNYATDNTKLYMTFYNGITTGAKTIYYRYHIYYNQLA